MVSYSQWRNIQQSISGDLQSNTHFPLYRIRWQFSFVAPFCFSIRRNLFYFMPNFILCDYDSGNGANKQNKWSRTMFSLDRHLIIKVYDHHHYYHNDQTSSKQKYGLGIDLNNKAKLMHQRKHYFLWKTVKPMLAFVVPQHDADDVTTTNNNNNNNNSWMMISFFHFIYIYIGWNINIHKYKFPMQEPFIFPLFMTTINYLIDVVMFLYNKQSFT